MRCSVFELKCFKVWICTGLHNHERTLKWCSGSSTVNCSLSNMPVTASGHRAHSAVLRKAPGGTCDPPGPAWSPMGVPKGKLEYFFISGFAQICANNSLNTFPHCKNKQELVSATGRGWICPLTRSPVSQEPEKGTGAPCHTPHLGCSEPWFQCQHLSDPRKKLPTLLQMWARSGRSVSDRRDDAAVLETLHQGWSLDSFRPMQCVSYSWNEKTWTSAWAFIADQETNEAKNVSLIPWLLQFSTEFVPDLAHLMIKRMWVEAHG